VRRVTSFGTRVRRAKTNLSAMAEARAAYQVREGQKGAAVSLGRTPIKEISK
jgi:hypothetical protein